MKRFLDRWCGALWHFRWYRRWYIWNFGMRRVFEGAAMETVRREAAALATNRRFLRDMGLDYDEETARELVDSASLYCEHCPIQGTCFVCGSYHGRDCA